MKMLLTRMRVLSARSRAMAMPLLNPPESSGLGTIRVSRSTRAPTLMGTAQVRPVVKGVKALDPENHSLEAGRPAEMSGILVQVETVLL